MDPATDKYRGNSVKKLSEKLTVYRREIRLNGPSLGWKDPLGILPHKVYGSA